MMGMVRCMIEYLIYRTEQDTSNYEASLHPRGDVQVTSVVFAAGEFRDLDHWWVHMWVRGGWAEEVGMENSLDESGSTRFGNWWSCRSCNIRSIA